jgi:hypothetical protein
VRALQALLAACVLAPGCKSPPASPRPPFAFTDVAREAGLDVLQVGGGPDVDFIIESLGCGAAWLDYDGDGDPDLYLAQGTTLQAPDAGPPDRLLRNDGDPDGDGVPRFVDVTEPAGLGDRRWSFGVAVADYDNDGDPDLYLTNWGPNRLYRNNGDRTFTDVAPQAGVDDPRFGTSAEWSDVDRDGDLDLYVANYVEFAVGRYPARGQAPAESPFACTWRGLEVFCGPRNLEPARDVFFRNDGDPDRDGVPRFTDATDEAGLSCRPAYALGVLFLDADGDGDDDLYVANDSVQNYFFRNRGDGTFDDVSLVSGLGFDEEGHEQASMGLAAADYDGDGWVDLAVTNFSHDHDTLYRNEGSNLFTDVSYPSGLGTASFLTLGWGVGFFDMDHDGWEDLFVAHGHVYPQVDGQALGTSFRQRNSVFRNLEGLGLEEVSAAGRGLELPERSRSTAFEDYDRDGDIDVLVTNLNDTPLLLRNDGAPGHWLQVRLAARSGNRDGIGSRIRLVAGGRSQLREVRRGSSFLASREPIAHFGLGSVALVERIEVRWPSGRTTVVERVQADRRLTIEEPL